MPLMEFSLQKQLDPLIKKDLKNYLNDEVWIIFFFYYCLILFMFRKFY
jgi:hypothetical protein